MAGIPLQALAALAIKASSFLSSASASAIDTEFLQPAAVIDFMEEHESALPDEASATICGTLVLPIRPRSRFNTSSKETEVSTSIRMPWNGLLSIIAFRAIFFA